VLKYVRLNSTLEAGVEKAIELELNRILGDLERIGKIIASKEAELGIAREISIDRVDDNCYELKLDSKSYFLSGEAVLSLKSMIEALEL
jgi:hypothetical protein